MTDRQERVRREVEGLLRAGVNGGVFPGASAAVGWREGDDRPRVEVAAGRLAHDSSAVNTDTLYDVASLTRLLVALTALRLAEAGDLALEQRADGILADLRDSAGGAATLRDLMLHRAGLAATGSLYLDLTHESGSAAARRVLVNEAARRASAHPSHNLTGYKEVVVSDLGYLLLGELMAKCCDQPLDALVQRWVTQPLGIEREMLFYGSVAKNQRAKRFANAAPTAHCDWRGRQLRGEALDCNCAALGGVAGHAGMFATARALLRLGQELARAWDGASSLWPANMLKPLGILDATAMLALARPINLVPSNPLGGRGGVFDLHPVRRLRTERSAPAMLAEGPMLSSITGVSLWWQRERQLTVALLSNRIFPSPSNDRIAAFGPAFFNGVLVAFDADQSLGVAG